MYKIWNRNEAGFLHKSKEFLVEIAIIVFAISLSIWLHDKSEHNHQQETVKEFLVGLREDLLTDIREMKQDRTSYLRQAQVFNYVVRLKPGQPFNGDSLRQYRKDGRSRHGRVRDCKLRFSLS